MSLISKFSLIAFFSCFSLYHSATLDTDNLDQAFLGFAEAKLLTEDSQVAEWEVIHSRARALPDFHPETTHVPGVFQKVRLVASYVFHALLEQENTEPRRAKVEEILRNAQDLESSQKLTLSGATLLMDELAIAADVTYDMEALREAVPTETLQDADVMILCVPKGGLSVKRIVEGFLHKTPRVFISLPAKALEVGKGPHAGHRNTVYDFYRHDTSHADIFQNTHRHWQLFWPAYERIKNIYNTLSDDDKKIVQAWLFWFFHEDESLVNHWYNWDRSKPGWEMFEEWKQTTKHLPERVQRLIQEEQSDFSAFVDRMVRATLNPEVSNSPLPSLEKIQADLQQKFGEGKYMLGFAGDVPTEFPIAGPVKFECKLNRYLPVNGIMTSLFADRLEALVEIDDISKESVQVSLTIAGSTYHFTEEESSQYFLADSYQDMLYFLKYAGKGAGWDKVHFGNYKAIRRAFFELCQRAGEIIKLSAAQSIV